MMVTMTKMTRNALNKGNITNVSVDFEDGVYKGMTITYSNGTWYKETATEEDALPKWEWTQYQSPRTLYHYSVG